MYFQQFLDLILTCVPVPYELILNPFFCKSLCPSILRFIFDEHMTAIRSVSFRDSGSKLCILKIIMALKITLLRIVAVLNGL